MVPNSCGPDTPSVVEEFGEISYNHDHPEVQGTHAYGLASSMYDVLNHVCIDRVLGKARDYKVDLAIGPHLPQTSANDLLIFDRNYPRYLLISLLVLGGRQFLIRCSASSFTKARQMLEDQGTHNQMVTLTPPRAKVGDVCFHDLPEALQVRFVRGLLETGDDEVLVTNLLDPLTFPTEEFKTIYHLRWGVEGVDHILKNRLNLENFTGKPADAVYQDFYAAVYLTGLEPLLTCEVNNSLAQKPTPYLQPVNHAMAFNAIKNKAFELLASDLDSQTLIERLEVLFPKTPTLNKDGT